MTTALLSGRSEAAQLVTERHELQNSGYSELAELAVIYQAKGLSLATAEKVASELTAHDALAAHAEAELHIDPQNLAIPVHAAAASAFSLLIGALLPMVAILLHTPGWRVVVTAAAVLAALAFTGAVSARIGGSSPRRAVLRVVIGGAAGLALTFGIGRLFGGAVGGYAANAATARPDSSELWLPVRASAAA